MSQQAGFLGNMETTIIGEVRSFTRYNIDEGAKGAYIWVCTPNDGLNPNVLGDQIIKIGMPYEMFDQQKDKLAQGLIKVPGMFEVHARVVMAGGNKAALNALSIRQHLPESDPLVTAPAGTSKSFSPAPTPSK